MDVDIHRLLEENERLKKELAEALDAEDTLRQMRHQNEAEIKRLNELINALNCAVL